MPFTKEEKSKYYKRRRELRKATETPANPTTSSEYPNIDKIIETAIPGIYTKTVHLGDSLIQYTKSLKTAFYYASQLIKEGDIKPPIVRYLDLELHFTFNKLEEMK